MVLEEKTSYTPCNDASRSTWRTEQVILKDNLRSPFSFAMSNMFKYIETRRSLLEGNSRVLHQSTPGPQPWPKYLGSITCTNTAQRVSNLYSFIQHSFPYLMSLEQFINIRTTWINEQKRTTSSTSPENKISSGGRTNLTQANNLARNLC